MMITVDFAVHLKPYLSITVEQSMVGSSHFPNLIMAGACRPPTWLCAMAIPIAGQGGGAAVPAAGGAPPCHQPAIRRPGTYLCPPELEHSSSS